MPDGTVAGCHDNMTALGVKSRMVGSALGKIGAAIENHTLYIILMISGKE